MYYIYVHISPRVSFSMKVTVYIYICKHQVTIEHHIDLCAPRSNHSGSVDPGLISHGHGDWFGVGSHRIGGDRNRNYLAYLVYLFFLKFMMEVSFSNYVLMLKLLFK